MYLRSLRFTVALVAGLSFISLPALAHHGWGGNAGPMTLTGTLTQGVSLSGPHANMQIRTDDGQVWSVTLAPAPRTHRAGLTEDVIPVGEEVTITGERNADQSIYEIKTRRVSWNGQNFDVYPPQ